MKGWWGKREVYTKSWGIERLELYGLRISTGDFVCVYGSY